MDIVIQSILMILETYIVFLVAGHVVGAFAFIFSYELPYLIESTKADCLIKKWLMILFAPICFGLCKLAIWRERNKFIARK